MEKGSSQGIGEKQEDLIYDFGMRSSKAKGERKKAKVKKNHNIQYPISNIQQMNIRCVPSSKSDGNNDLPITDN